MLQSPGWMLRTQALGSGRGQSSIKMKYVLRRAVVLTRRHRSRARATNFNFPPPGSALGSWGQSWGRSWGLPELCQGGTGHPEVSGGRPPCWSCLLLQRLEPLDVSLPSGWLLMFPCGLSGLVPACQALLGALLPVRAPCEWPG